jgi:hypothetical protein
MRRQHIDTSIELEASVTVADASLDVTVALEVEGMRRPARWGWDGGSSEELPSATIVRVLTRDDNDREVEIDLRTLSARDRERIETRAIEMAIAEPDARSALLDEEHDARFEYARDHGAARLG